MTTPTTSGTRRIDKRELALHRNNFHANRLTGPLLRWRDLSDEVKGVVTQEFIINSRGVADWNLEAVYAETMHAWGIMCPHPFRQRLYDGWRASDDPVSFEESAWFSCRLCNTRVINRDA